MTEPFLYLDEKTAHVIMGALAVAYGEGITGCDHAAFPVLESYEAQACALVKAIYQLHPAICEMYSWLPEVKACQK